MRIQHKKNKYNKKTFDSIIYNKNKLIDIISNPICLEKYKHPRNLKMRASILYYLFTYDKY